MTWKERVSGSDVPFNEDGNMVVRLQVCMFGSFRFFLCVVYLKPRCSLRVFMRAWEYIQKVLAIGGPTLIIGDFNARHRLLGDPRARGRRGVELLQRCDDLTPS